MIRIAFTDSPYSPASALIRYFSHPEPWKMSLSSHCAVVFNRQYVIDSNISKGAQVTPYATWIRSKRIVHCLEYTPELSKETAFQLYDRILDQTNKAAYDLRSLIWLGWKMFRLKFFKEPIPNENPYDLEHQFFCNEIVENMIFLLGLPLDPHIARTLPPEGFYEALAKLPEFRESKIV